MQFHPSTLAKRKAFYQKEFSIRKAAAFLSQLPSKPQYFTIDAGTESKIIKNKKDANTIFTFPPNLSLQQVKARCIRHLPEDVYYDRNLYKSVKLTEKLLAKNNPPDYNKQNILAQQLAFDLDVENLSCSKCKKNKQELKHHTLKMHRQLKKLHFKELKIVYTGRGYHLHVFDQKAYTLSVNERRAINKKLKDFPIDPWVSSGEVRLIRLPYSLNALVSRKVIPLNLQQLKSFNPEQQAIPRFLS